MLFIKLLRVNFLHSSDDKSKKDPEVFKGGEEWKYCVAAIQEQTSTIIYCCLFAK